MKRNKIYITLMAGLVLCSSSIVNAEVGGTITRNLIQPIPISQPIDAIDDFHFVLQVNNKGVDVSKNKPYHAEKGTMIPLTSVLENLGYHINWEESQRTILVKEQGKKIMSIQVDHKNMVTEGGRTIPVNIEIKDGRSFVPMNFFRDFLEAEVSMDETGVIKISTEKNIQLPEIVGMVEEVKNLEGKIGFLVKGELGTNGDLDQVMVFVDEETKLIGVKKEEIQEGMKLKVSYGPTTTRSIPAQSVAKKIEAIDSIEANQNLREGRITKISNSKDSIKILVGDIQEGMYLTVSKDTEIIDEKGNPLKVEALKEDISVKAYHSNIMTMSIPPMSQALKIVVCE
ncbi:copper amine oxidase N-terminal domain-containing protein [Clostridiaceae bacterium 35-E11]